jgi:hypothetical protein
MLLTQTFANIPILFLNVIYMSIFLIGVLCMVYFYCLHLILGSLQHNVLWII